MRKAKPYPKAYSERTYKRTVQLKRRNWSRKAATAPNAELDGCTSDCAVLLRSWRTKRGGIIRERHLSMRVLSVVPRHAVTVGSPARGNGDMGATRKAIRPVDGL